MLLYSSAKILQCVRPSTMMHEVESGCISRSYF